MGKTSMNCYNCDHDKEIIYKTINGIKLRMLIFNPQECDDNKTLSSVLLIHGGGWTCGSPDSPLYKQIARSFNAIGLCTFSIQYRLAMNNSLTVDDCVKDARSAMRFLKANASELGVDINKVVVCGGSAGAHLALSTIMFSTINSDDDLSISTTPAAAILFSPVIDTSAEGYGNTMLGDRWREFSPLENIQPQMPPVIIFHAEDDVITPYSGVVKFREAMNKRGNQCELYSYPEGGHGFIKDNHDAYSDVMLNIERFLGLWNLKSAGINNKAIAPRLFARIPSAVELPHGVH